MAITIMNFHDVITNIFKNMILRCYEDKSENDRHCHDKEKLK